ncbi:28S ribosomal protein S10 [Mactra antiquata]
MAASLRKLVPTTFNLVLKQVRPERLVCSCKNEFISLNTLQESLVKPSFETLSFRRCIGTSSVAQTEKQKADVVKVKKQKILESEEQTTETMVSEDDEEDLDVLYKRLIIEVKGHDFAVLKSYTKFVKLAAKHLQLNFQQCSTPPKHIFRQSVLKSVHIFKKHFVQYEQRTHYQIYELTKITGSTADTYLEYIQRNLPEGVAMKVTKHRLENLPDHLKPPQNSPLQIEHSTS